MSSASAILGSIINTSKGPRFGLWSGTVEDTDDPRGMDRVRVRLPDIHGKNNQTSTSALPWAECRDIGGGSYDTGSGGAEFIVGSNVWVMFEKGDEEFPVVVGGRRGIAKRNDSNPQEVNTLNGTDESKSEQTWLPTEGNEFPSDLFQDQVYDDKHPTRTVWRKSYKGHTIVVEDRDGEEFLRIIDRAGQVIEMYCPVTVTDNKNNGEQRGSRNALDDNQISQSKIEGGLAHIKIKDIAGQEITLEGYSNNEKIKLKSRNRLGTTIQQLILNSAKGNEYIELSDRDGNIIKIDPNGEKFIQILDSNSSEISFNSDKSLSVATAIMELTSTGNSTETVGGVKTELVQGGLVQQVVGNTKISVGNDKIEGIVGNNNVSIGGGLNVLATNTPPGGVPSQYGINLQSTLGTAGAIRLGCPAQTFGVHLSNMLDGLIPVPSVPPAPPTPLTLHGIAHGEVITYILAQLIIGLQAAPYLGNLGAPVVPNPVFVTLLNTLVPLLGPSLSYSLFHKVGPL